KKNPRKSPENSQIILGLFSDFSWLIPGFFPAPSWIFPRNFPGHSQIIPRKFPKKSKKIPRKFPENLKKKIPENSQIIKKKKSQKIPRKFPENFLSEFPDFRIRRHSIPPFIPLQLLARRFLPRQLREFLVLLFQHLNAFVARREQLRQLREEFSEFIQGIPSHNSLFNLLSFRYRIPGKIPRQFPEFRARLRYRDPLRSLPSDVTVTTPGERRCQGGPGIFPTIPMEFFSQNSHEIFPQFQGIFPRIPFDFSHNSMEFFPEFQGIFPLIP
uniref:Centromere protein O n=1 Tax=Cyanistes caeruleus TaxID=156563 RepID=A0A8C0U133_CYACU